MRHLNLATRPLNSATRQKCNYDPNGLPYTNRECSVHFWESTLDSQFDDVHILHRNHKWKEDEIKIV